MPNVPTAVSFDVDLVFLQNKRSKFKVLDDRDIK
jgi:hypothetical protein